MHQIDSAQTHLKRNGAPCSKETTAQHASHHGGQHQSYERSKTVHHKQRIGPHSRFRLACWCRVLSKPERECQFEWDE